MFASKQFDVANVVRIIVNSSSFNEKNEFYPSFFIIFVFFYTF